VREHCLQRRIGLRRGGRERPQVHQCRRPAEHRGRQGIDQAFRSLGNGVEHRTACRSANWRSLENVCGGGLALQGLPSSLVSRVTLDSRFAPEDLLPRSAFGALRGLAVAPLGRRFLPSLPTGFCVSPYPPRVHRGIVSALPGRRKGRKPRHSLSFSFCPLMGLTAIGRSQCLRWVICYRNTIPLRGRFSPDCDRTADIALGPKSAINGSGPTHSITSIGTGEKVVRNGQSQRLGRALYSEPVQIG